MADRPPRDTEDSSPDDSSSNQGCCVGFPYFRKCMCISCRRNSPAPTESQSSSTSSEIPQVQESGVRSDVEGSSRPLQQEESTVVSQRGVCGTSSQLTGAPSSPLSQLVIHRRVGSRIPSNLGSSSRPLQQEESTVDSQRGVSGTSSQLTGAPSSPLSQLVIHKRVGSRIPSNLGSSSRSAPEEESSASVSEIGDPSSPATSEKQTKKIIGQILPPSALQLPVGSSVEPGPYSPHDGEPSKPILKRSRTDSETEPEPKEGKKLSLVTFPGLPPRTPSTEQTSAPTSPSSVVVETEPAPVEERSQHAFVVPAPLPPPGPENPLPPAPPSTPDDAPDDVSTP